VAVAATVHASGATSPIAAAQAGKRKAAGLGLDGSPKSARVDVGYGGGAEGASGAAAGAGAGFVAEVAGAAEEEAAGTMSMGTSMGTSMGLMMTTPAHAPALARPATSAKQKRENEAKVKAAYEAKGPMTVSYQSWKRGLHPMQVEAIVSGLPWETIQPACVALQ